MQTEKYEVIDNHEHSPKTLGTVSWDGSALEFKPAQLERKFWGMDIHTADRILTIDDGLDFIKAMRHHCRSGYIALRRIA